MKKSDLINELSAITGVTKTDVGSVMNALALIAKKNLLDRKDVVVPGVVKLSMKHRAARTGRNPRTGETIQIAEKLVVSAKPARSLLESGAEE